MDAEGGALSVIQAAAGDPFAALSGARRWTAWKAVLRKGRPTKVPFRTATEGSKSNDPATWLTRADAERVAAASGMSGVGIFLGPLDDGDLLVGLDADTCLGADGVMTAWARAALDAFATYAEISPGGAGWKAFGFVPRADRERLGALLDGRAGCSWTLDSDAAHKPGLSFYTDGRYFTVTGARYRAAPETLTTIPFAALEELVLRIGPSLTGRSQSRPTLRVVSAAAPLDRLRALSLSHRKLGALLSGDFSHLADQSRSGRDMSLMFYAVLAGFTRSEAFAAVRGFEHGCGAENDDRQLQRMWEKHRRNFPSLQRDEEDARPVVKLHAGALATIATEAEALLVQARVGLYQRGGALVRAADVPTAVADGKSVTAPRLLQLDTIRLLDKLSEVIRFVRFDARTQEWRTVPCPADVAKAIGGRAGDWTAPILTARIVAPTLRSDGSILDRPGYDPSSGLLLEPHGAFPPIAERPDRSEALSALAHLKDVLRDYPFVAAADRSAALSALLTAAIRRSLPTAPLYAITAPEAGSGKSLLVDVTSMLISGHPAPVITQAEREEFEKRIGAVLMAGDAIVSIDNCERPLGGELLAQILTQPSVKVRILGRSEMFEGAPAALWFATGNNLRIAGDLARRTILCRLDAGSERPELRKFGRDLRTYMSAERSRLLVDCLTILRAYHIAGRPLQPPTPFGSFEGWSGWVRAALLWLGEADPLDTMSAMRASDPQREALRAVMDAWRAAFGNKSVQSAEVIAAMLDDRRLREAVTTALGDAGHVNARSLGQWLSRHDGRRLGAWHLEGRQGAHGYMRWRVAGGDFSDIGESELVERGDLSSPESAR